MDIRSPSLAQLCSGWGKPGRSDLRHIEKGRTYVYGTYQGVQQLDTPPTKG